MGARTTLNALYAWIGLIAAVILSLVTGSWVVFLVSLTLMLTGYLHSGRIRPTSRRRRR